MNNDIIGKLENILGTPKGYMAVPKEIYDGNNQLFCSTAKSNGMINAGIEKDDLLTFEYIDTLNDGDIGCFYIKDMEPMCKRYFYDKINGFHILQFEDGKQAPILVKDEDESFQILGKLISITKPL